MTHWLDKKKKGRIKFSRTLRFALFLNELIVHGQENGILTILIINVYEGLVVNLYCSYNRLLNILYTTMPLGSIMWR